MNQYAELQPNRQFVDQKLREASGYTLRSEYVESRQTKVLKAQFLRETDRYVIEALPDTADQMPDGVWETYSEPRVSVEKSGE